MKQAASLTARPAATADLETFGEGMSERSGLVYQIDPLSDPRWSQVLSEHPRASVFHSCAWLEALRRTYGYEPVAYTTSCPEGPLTDALLFMRVDSWLTGHRLVSLPFSDHCDFLVEDPVRLQTIFRAIERDAREKNWRYIETRPLAPIAISTNLGLSTETYCFHQVDLHPDLATLFRNLHKNSIQRKILRAEREALRYEEGNSEALLDHFYRMLVITRQRHRVPAQPREWFLNLMDCFGDALKIRLAYKGTQAIAGMLTLQFKDTLIYKYGCSDADFNKLGSMHLLYWRSIEDAKKAGLKVFDLGRSDADQPGLITFKGRWGATQSSIVYTRYAAPGDKPGLLDPIGRWKVNLAKRVFSHVPKSVLSFVGSKLYKHIG